MASPNPESGKNDDNTSAETNSATNKTRVSRARATASLSETPRILAEIYAAEDEHRAKEQSYWQRQVFWQRIAAYATIAAFAAAAIYAYFAHQQVTESQHLSASAHDQVAKAEAANGIAKDAVAKADLREVSSARLRNDG